MSDRFQKQKFLEIIDNSYFTYFCIFGAVNDFIKNYQEEASVWIKPPEECDQDNLPDLLNCQAYRKILKQYVMRRLETIDAIVKQNFQDVIDSCDQVDVIFACDDSLKRNFRLDAYPQYKANRLLVKRSYKVQPIKEYVKNVLYKELELEERYGYKFITVEGAEGDDVIATTFMNFRDKYAGAILIASDHDFLQIDGIREFDLFGKEAKRTLGDEEVSADDFLLGKILMGDKSDNIKSVFMKCGPKTALKWTKDKAALKNQLSENAESANRFALNEKIISFKRIPESLSGKILRQVNEALYSEEVMNPATDIRQFMVW